MVQTGPDLGLITYNRDGKLVKHIYREKSKVTNVDDPEELTSKQEQLIDVFTLKVFALVLCRGSKIDKANLLFDLVTSGEDE